MLLLVPPDTRPVTLRFPVELAKAAGVAALCPPPSALNTLDQPSDFAALREWLLSQVKNADTLIVSCEQLCLGGMIPARRVNDSLTQARERLELLTQLKSLNPDLRILAMGVIVRVAHDDDPLEEKPYYGEHGAALRAYSEAFDRFERQPTSELKMALDELRSSLPPNILNDWLATRERNHQLHLDLLNLCAEGVIEHVCLTLDDTSTYGLAAHDRRALEARTDELKIWSQVDIYPGADEVPAVLVARIIQTDSLKIYVRYSGLLGVSAELLYEDRPAGELIKAQARAANCQLVDTLAEADLVLAVNTPATRQASSQPDFDTVDTAARHLPDFADFIARCVKTNKPVCLADIAYPNGAELRLMDVLEPLPLAKLSGYSAWNTAGNTLGSAIAMAVISQHVRDPKTWQHLLFERFVDDYLYQASVRPELQRRLSADPYDLGNSSGEATTLLDETMRVAATEFWETFTTDSYSLDWQSSSLAWPRLFTAVFDFELEENV